MKENDFIPTLAYFDIFDYPLTHQEMEKWMIEPRISPRRFAVDNIEELDGFYHLKGRSDLIETRKERYLIAEKKINRALRFARIFRLLPSVRMIAICNTLAFSNAHDDSDIDLFIITKPGTIWLTRFWLQSFLALLGIRPHDHGTSIKDALCLSFFITDEKLSLEDIRLEDDDVYLALWIAQLIPIYDPDDLYDRFYNDNSWIKNVLPNAYKNEISSVRKVKKSPFSFLFKIFTLRTWEPFLKESQYRLFPHTIKRMANKDRRVVIDNNMLKLHTNDRLKEFKKLWLEKLENLD